MMLADERADRLASLRSGERLTLIGLGAIGSWVARWLVANGIQATAYDDDIVSYKNLAAGAFSESDVGTYKANAVGIGRAMRWTINHTVGSAMLVCADHGETRRDAAKAADCCNIPFICAKANGSLWQVWHVAAGDHPDDFIAFDLAAEADPVLVPCGEASVGRVASLGAAAELLSIWTGFEVTVEEVEASYGVKYDPALGHALSNLWKVGRSEAEILANEAAQRTYKDAIEKQRRISDENAIEELREKRRARHEAKHRRRQTMHQRAIFYLDDGSLPREAARCSVSPREPLKALVEHEHRIQAQLVNQQLSLPDTIEIEEISA